MVRLTNKEWYSRILKKANETKLIIVSIDNHSGNIAGGVPIVIRCQTCGEKTEFNKVTSFLDRKQPCQSCYPVNEKANASRKQTIEKNNALKRALVIAAASQNPDFEVGNENRVSPAWRGVLWQAFNGQCFLTKQPSTDDDPLQIHHLYSRDAYPQLVNYFRNGVLIKKSLHVQFHQQFGGGQNTPRQFEIFIQKLIQKGLIQPPSLPYPWDLTSTSEDKCTKLEENFYKAGDVYQKAFEARVAERNHTLIEYLNHQNVYVNRYTQIHIKCNSCVKPSTEIKSVLVYMKSKCGLACCVYKARSEGFHKHKPNLWQKNLKQTMLDTKEKFLTLVNARGHVYHGCVYGQDLDIINTQTVVLLECPKHLPNQRVERTIREYKASAYGLPCCSKEYSKIKRQRIAKDYQEQIKNYLSRSDTA